MILLDTSTLLYWTLAPKLLSAQASLLIKQSEQIMVSSISVWEIGTKTKKGKLLLPRPFDLYVATIRSAKFLTFLPVDVNIWIETVALDWSHKDPADRTIVATAKQLGCPLITSDHAIRAFYPDAVW